MQRVFTLTPLLAMFSGAAQADTGQDGNETMARGYEIFHNIAFDTPPAPGNRGAGRTGWTSRPTPTGGGAMEIYSSFGHHEATGGGRSGQ